MTRFQRGLMHLIYLGGGDIARKNSADAAAVEMDLEHDLGRGFPVLAEQFLEHGDDEFHRRVVIIEHDDLVHLGWLHTLRAPLHYDRTSVIYAWPLGGLWWNGRGLCCHEFILASH